jgi:orotidine-5'-phosphate decarboxylase
MLNREMRKTSLQIVDYILVTLHPYLGPNYMKEVMENVLSHPRLSHYFPSYVLHAHLVKAQQEIFLGLNMSIDANKLVQFNVSLVKKNALLIAVTLNVSESNT